MCVEKGSLLPSPPVNLFAKGLVVGPLLTHRTSTAWEAVADLSLAKVLRAWLRSKLGSAPTAAL